MQQDHYNILVPDQITGERISKLQKRLGFSNTQFARVMQLPDRTFNNYKLNVTPVPKIYNEIFLSLERMAEKQDAERLADRILGMSSILLFGWLLYELAKSEEKIKPKKPTTKRRIKK
jgi:hypothetical protein